MISIFLGNVLVKPEFNVHLSQSSTDTHETEDLALSAEPGKYGIIFYNNDLIENTRNTGLLKAFSLVLS